MKQYLFLRKIALAAVFGFGSLVGFGQTPAIQWQRTLGGMDWDQLFSMQPTTDGGYILGGHSDSSPNSSSDKTQLGRGSEDFWVVKLDASGNKVWDKTFGGSGFDYLYSLRQTGDGGYILGGQSYSGMSGDKSQPSRGDSDYWIIKIDASGNKIWDKTYGGNRHDRINSIAQTTDGGYIVGGTSGSQQSGDKTQPHFGLNLNQAYDFWVIKLDSNGNKVWDKTFGGTEMDELSIVAQTFDGGYILGGYSGSGISGNKTAANYGGSHDYWVIKLDANGIKIWDKTYGSIFSDELHSLVQTPDGGYLLGGYGGSSSTSFKGGNDFWIVKINSNGVLLWEKAIGGSGSDNLYSLNQTSDGGFILGGISGSGISGDKTEASRDLFSHYYDYWVVKVDANGIKLWDKTIGGASMDELRSVHQTNDGGYIMAGTSNSLISGDKTFHRQYWDYWVVKLGPDATTDVHEPVTTLNLSIFPNPSQGKFQLQLNNLTAKTAELTVSDLVGRIVYQQELSVTNKQINQEINLPHVKGIYLLQVKTGEQVTTRKIVIE